MDVVGVSAPLAGARRWMLALRALQLLAAAAGGCLLASSNNELTVNGPLPGTDPAAGGAVADVAALAALAGLPLSWFIARGSRFALLAASLLLALASVTLLLGALGAPFEHLIAPTFEPLDELRAYAATAFGARSGTVTELVALLAGAMLVPLAVACAALVTAAGGIVLAFGGRPALIRAERGSLRRYAFSLRGSAAFAGSVTLWIPTVVLLAASTFAAGVAFGPIVNLKHNVATYVLWMYLRWNTLPAAASDVFGSLLTSQLRQGSIVLAFSLVMLALVTLVARLTWLLGRRLSLRSALRVREADARPHVFLIRSFKDEPAHVDEPFRWGRLFGNWRGRVALEEVLVDALWRYGPVLTIGKPGDRLSPLGAAREYVDDDRWRDRVHEYLSMARAIVILLGDTDNLAWECERVASFGLADRVLVVVPPVDDASFTRRWNALRRAFVPAANAELAPLIGGAHPLAVAFGAAGPAVVTTSRRRSRDAYELCLAAAVAATPLRALPNE